MRGLAIKWHGPRLTSRVENALDSAARVAAVRPIAGPDGKCSALGLSIQDWLWCSFDFYEGSHTLKGSAALEELVAADCS